ncbi:MAG: cupin domain-containing protein, partial [Alphaproteobacteria bacterium]|nr:cupin domain-containing protein [Alphaproteobacteria bacterium]
PFDSISIPQGVYRGFRHVSEGKGTLLTIIGGPDAGRVDWHPTITDAAEQSGLARNEAGDLVDA